VSYYLAGIVQESRLFYHCLHNRTSWN